MVECPLYVTRTRAEVKYPKRPTTTLLMFTLNEIDGMKKLWPSINFLVPGWIDQILVVDGGSTDGTIEFMTEHAIPFFIQEKPGTGAAFFESFKKVTSDILIVFSPDGNSDVSRIPELIKFMTEGFGRFSDIVIVSRYLEWAKSYDDDLVTKFGNWMFTGLFNFLFGAEISDLLVMYRGYWMQSLKLLDLSTGSDAWGTHILARAIGSGMHISEIPGNEPKRIGGVRKMRPIKNGIQELKMVLKEWRWLNSSWQ